MANIVGTYGMAVLLPYPKTIVTCYLTCFLFTILIQGSVMVGLYGGISPIIFFATMKEAILFVFAICSRVATIPLNLKCTKNLGVSDKIADFVIPFGAVMNMNGTAIYEAMAVIFASQVFGTSDHYSTGHAHRCVGLRWYRWHPWFWLGYADHRA